MGERHDTTIGVLIVDDQELIRTGLSLLIKDMDGIEIVCAADGAEKALTAATTYSNIDVALVDARMPQVSGPELIAQLRERFPHIKCILLTAFDEDDNLVGALQAGAVGYLLKDVSAADLEQAIRTAASGGKVLGPSAVNHAMALIASRAGTAADSVTTTASVDETTRGNTEHRDFLGVEAESTGATRPATDVAEIQMLLAMLTDRERQIAELVAHGKTNSEIASAVFLSTGTVKNHISHIFHTLGVRNRTELTALLTGTIQ